jgi:hypothetical protein
VNFCLSWIQKCAHGANRTHFDATLPLAAPR